MKSRQTFVDETHNEVPKAQAAYIHEAVYDKHGRLVSDTWYQLQASDRVVPAVKPHPPKPKKA